MRPSTNLDISHDPAGSRFLAVIEGKPAYMAYRRPDPETIDFCYTFVPPELRNRKIGRELVRHGVGWANARGLTVTASCGFVRRVIDEWG